MIELTPITPDNYDKVLKLDVAADQKSFVAPNVKTIADCKVYEGYEPLAISVDGEPVGMCMWGRDPDSGRYHIVRLMVDAAHQRKGYGRAGAKALIELIAAKPACNEIRLSFVPENQGAEALYTSLGFGRTGEVEDGEIVMALKV